MSPSKRLSLRYNYPSSKEESSLASPPFVYHQVYALGDDDVPAATNAVSIAESLSERALYIAGTFSELHMSVPLAPVEGETSSKIVLSAYGPTRSQNLTQAFVLKLQKPGLNTDDKVGFLWAKQSFVSSDTLIPSGNAVASTILSLKDGTGAVLLGIMKGPVEWEKPGATKDYMKLDALPSRSSMYVIRLDTSGNAVWGVTIPLTETDDDPNFPVACSGGIDERGNIVVVGTFRGKINLDEKFVIDSGSAETSASFAARINLENGSILSINRLKSPDLSNTANVAIGATASGADCGAGWIVTGCSDADSGKECFVGKLNQDPSDEQLSVLAQWNVGSGLDLHLLAKVGTLNVVNPAGGQCTYVVTGLRITDANKPNDPSSYVKAFASSDGAKLWSRDVTDPTNILKRGNRLAVGLAPSNDGNILVSGAGTVSQELGKELSVPDYPIRSGFLLKMNVKDGKVSSHRHLYRTTTSSHSYDGTPLALHALSNSTGIILAGAMRGPVPRFDGIEPMPSGEGGAGGGMSAWIAVLRAQKSVEKVDTTEPSPTPSPKPDPSGNPMPIPELTTENPWTSFVLVFLLAALLLIPIALCARKALRPITGGRSFALREFGSGPSSSRGSNERYLLNQEPFVDDEEVEEEEEIDRRNIEEEQKRRDAEGKGKGKGKETTTTAVGEHFRIESDDEDFFCVDADPNINE